MALIVFFGYRIGAVTAVKGGAPADPFAATFIAGMVGLFADTVLQKLKDLITALFPSQDERRDKMLPSSEAPIVESVEAVLADLKLRVKGKNFVQGASVTVNGRVRATTSVSANELFVKLDAQDKGSDAKIVVSNPDKQSSAEYVVKIPA